MLSQLCSFWEKSFIELAMRHFGLSAKGTEVSDYHLEAEIAACHAVAGSFAETDWQHILGCYEMLQRRKPSPVVELNKIIVLAKIEGAGKGLEELGKFQEN